MMIALDMDEVIAELLKATNSYYNNKHDTNFKLSDFDNYDWWNVWRISKEKAVEEFYSFMESPQSKEIKPVEGAIDAIKKLRGHHDLVIITSRQEEFKDNTLEWVKMYIPGLEDNIYFTNTLSKIYTPTKKSDIALELGVDILIDDQPKYIHDCVEKGIKGLLYDAPWNQTVLPNKNIIRVYSWDDVLNELDIS
jgi:5'(3')-deoxyribonucleotidase